MIAFVANTGGLLGLCMGFSLVSLFEILYHVLGAVSKWWGSSPRSKSPWNVRGFQHPLNTRSRPEMELDTIANNGIISKQVSVDKANTIDHVKKRQKDSIQNPTSAGDIDQHSCERLL